MPRKKGKKKVSIQIGNKKLVYGKTLFDMKCSNDLYDNGKIRSEFEMLNGLKHGTGKDFDEYGNIESEYNHKDDLLTGSHKSFYKNGVLKRDIKYKNGMIVDCISYNKDGTQIVQNEQQKEITKKLMDHVNKEYGPE